VNVDARPATRRLLLCGAVAGPLFLLVVLLQDYSRPGVDPRLQPLSLLALGSWGWLQILNFVGAGVLNLGYAIGLRRVLPRGGSGTAAPVLIAAYGLGLVAAGVFRTDPEHGFPPGAREPASLSWHGALHNVGGLVVFLSLAGALVAFALQLRRRRERGWALYALGSAVVLLVLFVAGTAGIDGWEARALRLGTLVGWMAASLIAVKVESDRAAG
jgi:hypothetical protein